MRHVISLGLLGLSAFATPAMASWVPSHVVVVVEENHGYGDIIGNANAPYINELASQNASFTNSHGVEHPSQPNYLDLFSGSNQGVTGDYAIPSTPFSTANLASTLAARGRSFTGYSESLPAPGSLAYNSTDNTYQRKHNPWSDWQSATPGANQLAASVNQPFTAFPTNFANLPTVSFVIPNEANDEHGVPPAYAVPDQQLIANSDTWLQTNIYPYAQWAKANNSLLVVTWDEDDFTAANQVPTILAGAHVEPGQYGQDINHYNVLRTVEDFYGADPVGASAGAAPITAAFAVPEPATYALVAAGLLGLVVTRRRRA